MTVPSAKHHNKEYPNIAPLRDGKTVSPLPIVTEAMITPGPKILSMPQNVRLRTSGGRSGNLEAESGMALATSLQRSVTCRNQTCREAVPFAQQGAATDPTAEVVRRKTHPVTGSGYLQREVRDPVLG